MASTAVAKSDIARKWWLWPLVPFVFLASVFGIIAFFILVGVAWPFLIIKLRRDRKKIKQQLVAERRLVSWDDAILARSDEGKILVLEYEPPGLGSMWLMDVSPEAHQTLMACPTYASWEADPSCALEGWMEIDKLRLDLLEPYSQVAKRIEDRPRNLRELDEQIKESIRVLPVLCDATPTRYLYQWLRNTKNA